MTLKNRDRHRSNRCFQPAVRPLELRELLTGNPGYVLQQGIPSGQIGLLAGDYDSTLYDTSAYEAIIDWGDGTSDQNTSPEDNQWMSNIVRIANESFMVTGSHTYGSLGNFTISTTFVSYPFDETTPVLYAASTTSVTVVAPGGDPDPADSDLPVVSIEAIDPAASRVDGDPGQFLVSRNGESSGALTVHYTVSGTAVAGVDYQSLPGVVIIPDGEPSVTVDLRPILSQSNQSDTTINVKLSAMSEYRIDNFSHAAVDIAGQSLQNPPDGGTMKYNHIWIERSRIGYSMVPPGEEDNRWILGSSSIITVYRDGNLSDSANVDLTITFPDRSSSPYDENSNNVYNEIFPFLLGIYYSKYDILKKSGLWHIQFIIPINQRSVRLEVSAAYYIPNRYFGFEMSLRPATSSNSNTFYKLLSDDRDSARSRFVRNNHSNLPLRETGTSSIETSAGRESNASVATFADDPNPFSQPTDDSSTIDWGDGTTSPGNISSIEGQFHVAGTHIYNEPGWFPIKVTIISSLDAKTLVALSTALVSDPLLTVSSPGQLGHDEGASIAVPIIADDAEDSTLAYGASGLPEGLSINPETGLISGTIAAGAASRGPYDVKVVVYTDHSIAEMSFRWVVYLAAGGPTVAVKASDWGSSGGYQGIGPIPATFTISRNSGRNPLMVYFKLGGSATLGVDYTYTMPSGSGGGYIDESTGEGYATIPADAPGFPIIITSLLGNDASNKTVDLTLMGPNSQFFNGILGYQLPTTTIATATITAPTIYTVSGQVQYGNMLPVRFALVKIYESLPAMPTAIPVQPARRVLIGEVYTNKDGFYELKRASFNSDATGLIAGVFPQSDPSEQMQIVDVHSLGRNYSFSVESGTVPGPNTPPMVTMPSINITSSTISGKAFWVYDAAVTAARFHGSLPGFKQATTTIYYPTQLTQDPRGRLLSSWTLGETPHIQERDYDNKDGIIHEYAHVVAQDSDIFPDDIV